MNPLAIFIKFIDCNVLMKFIPTTASSKAIEEIKKRMLEQHENKDISKFRLKFTKKKEFLAVPSLYFGCPAFRLYINNSPFATYIFRNKKWKRFD